MVALVEALHNGLGVAGELLTLLRAVGHADVCTTMCQLSLGVVGVDLASRAGKSGLAEASAVVAGAVSVAIVLAHARAAVVATPAGAALADTLCTVTIARALVLASLLVASGASPGQLVRADAGAVGALAAVGATLAGGALRTLGLRAPLTIVLSSALASTIHACAKGHLASGEALLDVTGRAGIFILAHALAGDKVASAVGGVRAT